MAIEPIQGMEGGESVLTDSSDRAEVIFDLDSFDYDEIDENHRLTVIFTTDAGASTEQEIRAPSTFIEGEDSVRL